MATMKSELFFSVIIPLYNKSAFIMRAIESVLNQSYINFEIVIVDDGSKDDGVLKVEKLNNERIKVVKQENQGVSKARNVGVENSKFGYVVFLDADDTWEISFLEKLKDLILLFPKAGIYGINNNFHYENNKIRFINFDWIFDGNENGIIDDYFEVFSKLGKSPFSNSSCCFSKSIFNDVGGYRVGVRTTEDSDLWCRIALNHEVAFHTKPLANYYLEIPNNTSSILDFVDFQVSITLQELIRLHKVPSKFIKSVKKLIAFQQFSLIKRAILTGNNLFAIKKIFDRRLVFEYPFKSLFLFFLALVPFKIFSSLRMSFKKVY
jgi:glycosyltransferase involved in cell wall biosynthesis